MERKVLQTIGDAFASMPTGFRFGEVHDGVVHIAQIGLVAEHVSDDVARFDVRARSSKDSRRIPSSISHRHSLGHAHVSQHFVIGEDSDVKLTAGLDHVSIENHFDEVVIT